MMKSQSAQYKFDPLWTATPTFGAEIAAYAASTNQVWVTGSDGLSILNANNGAAVSTLSVATMANDASNANISLQLLGGVNSVAIRGNTVAIAVDANTKTDNGAVFFYDTAGNFKGAAEVGSVPDMVTFAPDGRVLVANEAEQVRSGNTLTDPAGGVSIIDISDVANPVVNTIGFGACDSGALNCTARVASDITFANDLEPEYITVAQTSDGKTKAYVGLQENNAFAIIDLSNGAAQLETVKSLGTKDHSLPGNGFDASNRDDIDGNIQTQPNVQGLYMPDAIASYTVDGKTYIVTANEGDSRDAGDDRAYTDEIRVGDIDASNSAFLTPDLQDDAALGRLKVVGTNQDAHIAGDDPLGLNDFIDIDGDRVADNLNANGEVDTLFSFGGRSFSIWDENGDLVFDSGDQLEQILANDFPQFWQDGRSDDKGPEPEGVDVFEVNGRFLALIGKERTDTTAVFDVTDPTNPEFIDLLHNDGDESPEGILAIMASESGLLIDGIASDFIIISNEDSGTATAYSVKPVPLPAAVWLMLGGLAVLLRFRKR